MWGSAAEALDWAYNTQARSIVNLSAVNGMRQGKVYHCPNYLIIGITPLEAHGQASQIIGMVEDLYKPESREYIAAKFGHRVSPDDIETLVSNGCAALGTGQRRNGVYRVMRCYFSGNMSVRTLRRELGCRHQYAVEAKNRLYDVLDLIHDNSMSEISRVLERHGIIELSRYE